MIAAPTTPATLGELAGWAADRYGAAPAQRWCRDGVWEQRSYAELAGRVGDVAAGLRAIGVRPGDRVALLSGTRPEWTICDLAIATVGAVCVPVYPTNSATECAWVLADSGATALVCETDEHLSKVAKVWDRLPDLRAVFAIEDGTGAAGLDELIAHGADHGAVPCAVGPGGDGLATIVYTSGTTGNPKGCRLTHRNWRAALEAVAGVSTLGPADTVYLYLPLAHLFARMVQVSTLERGAALAYYGGDMSAVVAELVEVAPTHLPSVPRLFEKVYGAVTGQVPAAEQERFDATVELGLRVRAARQRGAAVSETDAAAFELAEGRLYTPVRAAFGGRVREALSGAAPIDPEILRFFFACGVPIYEAYGMTETTALISANTPDAVSFGTVGRPLPGVEVRIAANGEVQARGANVFTGYWQDEAATAAALDGGWLHTGDLGDLDADGYLTITGRAKDIITAGGKNLTPANLEGDLRRCRWIAEAVLCGDRRPYPVALLTLDPEEVLPWAREHGLGDDLGRLATDPQLRGMVQRAVDEANERYAPPERIRAFAILPHGFGVDSGELTPSLKVRRSVVVERYRDVLDLLYRED
jgi:long-chain acyl-CoA synthetase